VALVKVLSCELFHRLPWGMMKSCSFLATALWRSDARLLFPALFHDGVLSGSQGGLAGGENGRCRCPELRFIGIPGADMNACFDVYFDV